MFSLLLSTRFKAICYTIGVDEVFGTVVPLEEIPFSAVRSVRGADFVTL